MSDLGKLTILAGFLLPLLFYTGCTSKDSTPMGTVGVRLVDGPLEGYKEINVHIRSVEIQSGSGWITLGSPDKTYDLLTLRNGVSAELVGGVGLAAGQYNQMRLILGEGNTVKLANDEVHDLKVPSGMQTGIKLNVHFEVAAGTTKDIWIDFDAAHSIHMVNAGASGQFILRPVVKAFDKVTTGSISGVLKEEGTETPLAGAMVYAQSLDLNGEPSIARTVTTDQNGAYSLDLLPLGQAYFVVSQPKANAKVYAAKASGEVTLTEQTPTYTYQASFAAVTALGHVAGTVTPAATLDQGDHIYLRKLLSPEGGSGSHLFIVNTTTGLVAGGIESFGFTEIPAGDYSLKARRVDGDSVTHSTEALSTVEEGQTSVVELVF